MREGSPRLLAPSTRLGAAATNPVTQPGGGRAVSSQRQGGACWDQLRGIARAYFRGVSRLEVVARPLLPLGADAGAPDKAGGGSCPAASPWPSPRWVPGGASRVGPWAITSEQHTSQL